MQLDILACYMTYLVVSLASYLPATIFADYGYQAQVVLSNCYTDYECDTRKGMQCSWSYDSGCGKGKCRCPPGQFRDSREQYCTPRKIGGETCTSSDACIRGMSCTSGVCSCGNSKRMSSDFLWCLEREEKTIGEVCNSQSRCLSKGDHTYYSEKARCHKNRCQCLDKYVRDGLRCRKFDLNERGCRIDDTCRGGALCRNRHCRCPDKYVPSVGGNFLCIPRRASVTQTLGATCDPTGRRDICMPGLQCFGCNSGHSRCIRAFDGFDFSSSIKLGHHTSIMLLISCLTLILIR